MTYLHGGDNETPFSHSEMREVFNKTAVALGMDETLAPMLGQSVWHLCNRGFDGITHAIMFLLLNKKDLAEIWRHPKYPIVNDDRYWLCPFRTAMIVTEKIRESQEGGDLDSFELVIPKPAAPFLCLPVLANALKQSKSPYSAVQISGNGVRVAMSDQGMIETAKTLDHEFRWMGSSKDAATPIQFTLLKELDHSAEDFIPKTRHTTLWLPTNRLSADGALNLN